MDNKELVLLGSSMPLPELDPEENEWREIDAFKKYVSMTIRDNMGKPEFEIVYKSSLDVIDQMAMKEKVFLCQEVLKNIRDLYGYEFPFKIDLSEKLNIKKVFFLLEFIEYGCVSFLADVWKRLDIDLRLIDIEGFVNNNIEQIIIQIETHVQDTIYSELINLFLRTINKQELIRYMILKSQNFKMEIVLKIMEGEANDNG